MKLGAIVAAAVVAVGVGQAEAATYSTATYDMFVRYEGTAFTRVSFAPITHDHYGFEDKDIEAGDTSLGLKSYLFGLPAIGTIFQFSITLVQPHVPVEDDYYYGNGGRTPVCQLGPWDCTATNYTEIRPNGFSAYHDDEYWMNVSTAVGSTFDVGFWSTHAREQGRPFIAADGNHYYWYNDEYSRFTVLDVNAPAPVPLPATAALLPLGIGTLAMMRKRRRPR